MPSPRCDLIEERYDVIGIVGSGGMGAVYQARHKILPKSVAIKVLSDKLLPDARSRLRFEQEAKAAAAFSHANIPGVHDYGITDDGNPFIVMDYVEGKSLSEVINESGPLAENECISIFSQVTSALRHAHSRGVIHRDVKPSNLMERSTWFTAGWNL